MSFRDLLCFQALGFAKAARVSQQAYSKAPLVMEPISVYMGLRELANNLQR